MKFTLSRPMLSISNFPSCDLPNFTLITGKNGVGKSHLLQAIESGAVIAEGVQAGQNQIVRYDWATMAPNDAGAFSSDSLNQERQPIVERIRATRDLVRNRAVQFLLEQSLGVPAKFSIDQFGPLISEAKLKTGSPQDEQIFTSIENELDQILNSQMNPQFGNWNTISQEICKKRGKRIYQLSSDDFDLESYPAWGGTSLFQQQLSRIFVLYHELRLANFARKGANQPHLSEQEFTERYGRAPWDYLNELLASNGIEFRINHPKQFVREPFIPRLTKINSNAEVQFSALSSGERILVSFAICLYNTLDGRQLVHLPKLLLFDEVDAPLHPSMSKIYIDSIQHSLVEKSGLSVIATTHSPTTVALAPEESIYLMQPDGLGLRKVSKSEALNVLTEGVPTLAVSFDGRRQVFVESPIDAELYDLVFQLVKSTIGSQRSLVFIPTGAKDKKTGTDQNTGSSVVSSLVKSLINSGNQTVFGVLDWDKHHTSSERICILSENRRYSIENVIYDPAVVIAFLCKEAKSRKDLASLPRLEKLSYSELLLLDSKEFQELVDEFSNLLVPNTLADTSKEVCNYLGGMQLQISTQLLLMNGHQLEDALIEKFPSLKGHKTHGIMKTIVESVFTDAKQLIPCDFLDLFRNLTNIATH